MNTKKLIKRYRKLLVDIKDDFDTLYVLTWRNEFRPDHYSHSFTHVYCRICDKVRLRHDKESINCLMNHPSCIHLERYESSF